MIPSLFCSAAGFNVNPALNARLFRVVGVVPLERTMGQDVTEMNDGKDRARGPPRHMFADDGAGACYYKQLQLGKKE